MTFNQFESMNKLNFLGCLGIFALATTMIACSSDDNTTDGGGSTTQATWTKNGGLDACDHVLFAESTTPSKTADNNGTQIGNGAQEFVFTGKQTIKKGTYSLKGWVYIADGAELTIEPGTIIKGDKETKAAIIAEPGGKLIAKGEANNPIVFTSEQPAGSRKPGDWGGIILCGNAKNNNGVLNQQIEGGPRTKHGGTNDADNSGVLQYVRIEFAGYPFQTDQEINGLTFGSVGSGTTIDHVQVSYSNDDSFEWFGGSVNCKYLIAYKGWDDDFDTDNGFSGKVQFGLSIRDPKIADKSSSNGFESDNNASGSDATPLTSAVFANMTFVGPRTTGGDSFQNTSGTGGYIDGGQMFPNNGSGLGKFQAAMQIRRNSNLSCFNSIAMGWPIGLLLDNEKGDCRKAFDDGNISLENLWFIDMEFLGSDKNGEYSDSYATWGTPDADGKKTATLDNSKGSYSHTAFLKDGYNNKSCTKAEAASWFNTTVPYLPTASATFLNVAKWTNSKVSSGFDKVNYIGAFSGANDKWYEGWAEFDPQNAKY